MMMMMMVMVMMMMVMMDQRIDKINSSRLIYLLVNT